jgi:hypothetical protein
VGGVIELRKTLIGALNPISDRGRQHERLRYFASDRPALRSLRAQAR